MAPERTERFTVNLTPDQLAWLDQFAEQNHWSRSTAVAVLIERARSGEA
jgi:hypothetical protein